MKSNIRKFHNTILILNLGIPIFFCALPVRLVFAESEILLPCAQKFPDEDAERLKCYDQLAVPPSLSGQSTQESLIHKQESETTAGLGTPMFSTERSYLTRVWNLDDLSTLDPSKLGRLHPYRQNYLIIKKTNNPNRQPSSPLIDHNVVLPIDLDTVEAKFQLSVKADIGDKSNVDFMGIKSIRFWGAYTQQSDWQVFNLRNSSPFRETVYEPELIVTLGTGHASGLKLINLGWLHQSNGSSLPESRSWNRIYVLGGWEWNDMTSILLRGWWRIPEDISKDDNPDISDYLGRADLILRWEPRDKSQAVAILLRDNLSVKKNRGFVQIDWATPVRFGSAARMHLQLTSGYGESLIDYNHRQNTIGLGFSFREW